MKQVCKKIKKTSKKTLGIFLILGILLTSVSWPPFMTVKAEGNNTSLEIQSNGNTISIDETDTYKLLYKIDTTVVGTVKVKLGENYLAPTMNNGKAEFALTEYTGETYQVKVEVSPSTGYQRQASYYYNGTPGSFPGDNIVGLDIKSNNVHSFDFKFEVEGSESNPGEGDPIPEINYPIVGYFAGIETGIEKNSTGSILMPTDWTSGNVYFKAKTCTVDGVLAPNDGVAPCDTDSETELSLRVEGIGNSSQIDGSATIGGKKEYLKVSTNFSNYGHAIVHLMSEDDTINAIISVDAESLITLTAEAPLAMSFGVGSTSVKQAIVTSDVERNLSVFFGNTTTTLIPAGPHVSKITAVTGATTVLNEDGSATITLPDLTKETTTQVKVTILLDNSTSVTRTVNIVRTAVMLEVDKRVNKVTAGYVMNKAYLYNNQAHSDSIFDAYLQVILYKDSTVVGYKQIKIDDEQIVNGLGSNEAASIETFDENPIVVFDGSIEGVNGVSVFLTNGPIKGSDDILPSIEYGIGAGVKITWEAE